MPYCRCRFWIPIFDFSLHFVVAAPNGPPVPPESPRCPTEDRGLEETDRLGVLWKEGVHQRDYNREDEDKKVHDDIELTCIK